MSPKDLWPEARKVDRRRQYLRVAKRCSFAKNSLSPTLSRKSSLEPLKLPRYIPNLEPLRWCTALRQRLTCELLN